MKKLSCYSTKTIIVIALLFAVLLPVQLGAQLASGYSKFLGNITYKGITPLNFTTYWNQITPENEGKWASCEQAKDDFNYWLWLDRSYALAQANNYTFKEHCFVWGHSSGDPAWIDSLTAAEQKAQVEQWIAAFAERFPDADLIDIVNEPLHIVPTYKDAIGGDGATGWDWVIWSYETARKYCTGKLLINDYNILYSAAGTNAYLGIINLLKSRGLIDGIGVQGHSLESVSAATIKANLDALAETGLPIYVSEYDVDSADDATQLSIYQNQFPILWEHWAVKGVTLWGYMQGEIWKANAYLIRTDGTERPAMQWLRTYLAGGNATSGPSPAPTDPPTAYFTESGGQVVMEAENYTNIYAGTGDFAAHSWVPDTSKTDASGGTHMFASPNSQIYSLGDPTSPAMGYFVNFSTTGKYYIWVRRASDGGGDDSCQFAMNNGGFIQWSYGGGSAFDWVKATDTFNIYAGVQMFKMGMREDGARVDKIILTTNASFTPTGTGPVESARTGGTITAAPTTPATDTPAPTDAPVVTPAPTDVTVNTIAPTTPPSDTPIPTDTPAPTAIPTATPYGVTADPTVPASDTIAPTTAPANTTAPTTLPTETTAPPAGCTCTNLCSSQTAITVPFTYDGAGEYCWTSSSLGSYVNSWNADAVNVNGTSCTNTYVSSSSIAAISGVYYIYCKSSYSWSHIEIK